MCTKGAVGNQVVLIPSCKEKIECKSAGTMVVREHESWSNISHELTHIIAQRAIYVQCAI